MTSAETATRDSIHELADHLAGLRYEMLPAQTVSQTRLNVLDCLGVAIAGAGTDAVCRKLVALTKDIGGRPESTIIGDGTQVPAHMAAFANAALTHALNYDDYLDPVITHFGCVVFPAAFAAAECARKVSGRELITACAGAVDFGARLSRALVTPGRQRNWNLHGWLTTQLFGYFGAAAAASRLLGLTRAELLNALGLAYSQAGGNKQQLVGVGADKGIYPAYAAQAGVLAARMAGAGINGPHDSLEGRNGLYNVFFDGCYDPAALTRDLGGAFTGSGFYVYPCCGFTHPRIELALKLRDEYHCEPRDIESVTVDVGPVSRLLCEPLATRRNPALTAEAQYSLPFTIAVALTRGKPRIEHFTGEGIRDPEVLAVANRVNYRIDERYDLQYGTGHCPAKLEVGLRGGRTLVLEQAGGRYGHPERPVSRERLIEKFRECANHAARPLPRDTVDRIIGMVDTLEAIEDVSELVRIVS